MEEKTKPEQSVGGVARPADPALQAVGERIGRRLGHRGILDADAFVDGEAICVIDLNPRFGGGYPFSHLAGADLPAAIIAWAEGRTPDPAWLRVAPNVTMARYDQYVVAARPSNPEEA